MKPERTFSKVLDVEATSSAEGLAHAFDVPHDDLVAWLTSLPDAPSLADDDPALEAEIAADLASGKGYPHSIVRRWLRTFGKPDFKPFEEWLKSAG